MVIAEPPIAKHASLRDVFVTAIADVPAPADAKASAATATIEAVIAPTRPASKPSGEPAEDRLNPRRADELLIILESGDLERTWGSLIMATTAAASGMKVSIFLTFWGFYPLVKPGIRITGENWMQKMLAFLNRPGIDHLRMSRLNFAGMGPWMARRLAKKHGVASPAELLQVAQALGVRLIPCQMTMDMFGLKREDLILEMGEPAGAATAIEIMTEADASLFI
jgi:peroxiredoxin family protein